jgi:hypothetical protein
MSVIIETADILRNRYRFEIDGCINPNKFFKAKLDNDKKKAKELCNNLYKKIK